MDLAETIIATIRRVVGNDDFVALHEPDIGPDESRLVQECLASGWVSSVGKFVDQFERDLAAFTGAEHAIAVVNGTAALHTSLRLVGVGPEDEVLCPALTFIATANAIAYCGAQPHFVDVAPDTLGVCPQRLDDHLRSVVRLRDGRAFNRMTGRRISAIVPMHTFGVPVDMDALTEVCQQYAIEIVEDAAESLGSRYRGRAAGTLGRVSAISFNGNKIITAGGGGAILTNDPDLARMAKHLTTTAKVPHRWEFQHDQVGFNYRMPNLNAALVVAQLGRLDEFLERKRALHEHYRREFASLQGVALHEAPADSESNYWLNTLILDEAEDLRDRLLEQGHTSGVAIRPVWQLASDAPMYQSCPRAPLDTSQHLVRTLVSLPSSPRLATAKRHQDAA